MDFSLWLKILYAFLAGGVLCVIAQLLIDLTKLTPARILVLYVTLGVLLGAVGVYPYLYECVGAGVSVPLIGFGGIIARGVKEAIHEHGWLGIFIGPLTASAAGVTAALVFGYLAAIIFKSKPKKM